MNYENELQTILDNALIRTKDILNKDYFTPVIVLNEIVKSSKYWKGMIFYLNNKLDYEINEYHLETAITMMTHSEEESNEVMSDILVSAQTLALKSNSPKICTVHLIASMCKIESNAKEILNEFDITTNSLVELHSSVNIKDILIKGSLTNETIKEENNKTIKEENNKTIPKYISTNMTNKINSTSTSTTPTLDNNAVNLNELAKKGLIKPIIGRKSELERAYITLSRKNKPNPLMIGEAGVGKTALVMEIARQIVAGESPEAFKDCIIFELQMNHLVSDTKYRGEFESKAKMILEELEANPNIIVFIDEIHTMMGAGNSTAGSLDFSNILKPYLATGKIRIIGSTTLNEFRITIEKDKALTRRFQKVFINEPNVEETKTILKGTKEHYEKFHNVTINDELIDITVDLANKYIKNQYFPDKAFDIIDETSARLKVKSINELNDKPEIVSLKSDINELDKERLEKMDNISLLIKNADYSNAHLTRVESVKISEKINDLKVELNKYMEDNEIESIVINKNDIYDTITNITKIPINEIMNKKADILNIDKVLKSKIIGQDSVIDEMSNILIRYKSGLKNPNKPDVVMYVGKTGVGKTLLAKEISKEVFKSKESFFRLNMNDYSASHTASNIIGSPKGYLGSDESTPFIEHVKNNPYSVILLDEIEKAHPSVFNTFLQIFDEGEFTTQNGEYVDFRNVMFIMTSNIGVASAYNKKQATSMMYSGNTSVTDHIMKEVNKFFKPELLNRVNKVIMFNSIEKEDTVKIVKLELLNKAKQYQELNLNIKFSDEFIEHIADKGYSEKFGARNILRVIDEEFEMLLGRYILKNPKRKNINVTYDNEIILN